MSKKLKTFKFYADITVYSTVDIKAESFEDALAKSRELGVSDFVEVLGEHNDSSLEIQGVFKE